MITVQAAYINAIMLPNSLDCCLALPSQRISFHP
jgi:hypothetical protein